MKEFALHIVLPDDVSVYSTPLKTQELTTQAHSAADIDVNPPSLKKNCTGTVKFFNSVKGWGFLHTKEYADVFVYFSDIQVDGYKTLNCKQNVAFDLHYSPKGLIAKNVILLS